MSIGATDINATGHKTHNALDAASPTATDEWESRIGDQFRALRLAAGKDQLALADAAGVSVGAIRNLERGAGSTLRTLVRVARVLGREDWLSAVAPNPSVSPIDVLRNTRAPRVRVYRPRGSGE